MAKNDDDPRHNKPRGNWLSKLRSAVKPGAGPRLASFWYLAYLGLTLTLIVALLLAALFGGLRQGAADKRRLASWTEAISAQVVMRLDELSTQLTRWGQDAELRKVLEETDPDELSRLEERLSWYIPASQAVHLRSREEALSPARNDPELSFAGHDLIRQAAETGKVTVLEVHRVGRPDSHLAIASPIFSALDHRVAGVMYLAIPLSWLPDTKGEEQAPGRLYYQQNVKDELITVHPAPSRSGPSIKPDQRQAIPRTRLSVAVQNTQNGWLDWVLVAELGGAYLLLAILMAVGILMVAQRQAKALRRDLAILLTQIEHAADGRLPRDKACRLVEIETVRVQARPLLEGLVGAEGRPTTGRGTISLDKTDTDAEAPDIADLDPELKNLLTNKRRPQKPKIQPSEARLAAVPAEIFRANDIRGLIGEGLTEALATEIGQAIGTEVLDIGGKSVFVGRDCRESSEAIASAMIAGLRRSGCNVNDLGLAPAPLLYFATCWQGEASGVMVTAGHNPPKYNGMKIALAGETLAAERLAELRDRILQEDFAEGDGAYRELDLVEPYCEQVDQDVTLARVMKIVVDCGQGAASVVAPGLYRRLGCQVEALGCEIAEDSTSNRVANPAQPDTLSLLAERVVAEGADLGLAFDMDGDRLGVIDSAGQFVPADRVLMLLATDILARNPGGDVVYDIACSRHLPAAIQRAVGRPIVARSGHARLKAKLRETGALIAGDPDGHMIFGDRWHPFDDALYAGARLLELLALDPRTSEEVLTALPASVATPTLYIPLADGEAEALVTTLVETAKETLSGATFTTTDGLRAELERGWGLIRPATNRSGLSLRFEADDDDHLRAVQEQFRRLLEGAAPDANLPF